MWPRVSEGKQEHIIQKYNINDEVDNGTLIDVACVSSCCCCDICIIQWVYQMILMFTKW